MAVYFLYGQRVSTTERIDVGLTSTDPPQLYYHPMRSNRLAELAPGDLIYSSRKRDQKHSDLPIIQIWHSLGVLTVQIAADGVYELTPDHIHYFPHPYTTPETQRICFLGTVLSLWLEWMGTLALHASAVVVQGQAVGFLSNSEAGKSTLAAAFVKGGFPFLTDDILAISFQSTQPVGHLSYPWMKLWPVQAEHFLQGGEDQFLVHPDSAKRFVRIGPGGFGSFWSEPAPLARLYIPERREASKQGGKVDIFTIPPQQAMIELMRYSFSGPLLRAIGVEAERLSKLAALVQQVPLKRVIYPAGFEYLPLVRDALVEDAQHN